MVIKGVQNTCRGPSLSRTDPLLLFTTKMEVSKGLQPALVSVQNALGSGTVAKQMVQKFKKLYNIRSYNITYE